MPKMDDSNKHRDQDFKITHLILLRISKIN